MQEGQESLGYNSVKTQISRHDSIQASSILCELGAHLNSKPNMRGGGQKGGKDPIVGTRLNGQRREDEI